MAVPPEVVFSRFFNQEFPYQPPVRPEDPDPREYKGRHDLSGLPPLLQQQLRGIQELYNEALRNEKQGVIGHVQHPCFHLDYVDANVLNALAFQYEGYSFIGITVPLVFAISDVCLLLSKSVPLAASLGLRPSSEEYNELHAAMFYILTAFVVGHEWTHHVHGHVWRPGATSPDFPNEIVDIGCDGNLEAQVHEVVADGYSIFHVLTNVLDSPNIIGGWTRSMLSALTVETEQADGQDRVLFSLCLAAVAAYFFIGSIPDLAETDFYRLKHPPQAIRLRFIALEASIWCSHFRPALDEWMSKRFMNLLIAVAEAMFGESGVQAWADQRAFLNSEAGRKYFNALNESLKAYKESYGTGEGQAAAV